MEPRQRKGKSALNSYGDGPSDTDDSRRRTKGESIDRTFTSVVLLLFVVSILAAISFTAFPDSMPKDLLVRIDAFLIRYGLKSGKEYAVVLDAGSTGSRVLGFTFYRTSEGSLRLDDELWMQVKPGLSSYAENPQDAKIGLLELLAAAKERIPAEHRASTPITLKATAGLRLLPKEKSEAILSEVRNVLESSGFKPEKNLIEIMNPMEEGLFGWFTVNFLLGHFENVKDLSGSFASLDLGGGSTQITFAPTSPIEGIEGRKHFRHSVSVLNQNFDVYSHSYLGLGLMAARSTVISMENPESFGGKVQLSCITSRNPKTWSFLGKTFEVSSKPSSSYESCYRLVSQIISGEKVHIPEELMERKVAAFSYFFDLANEHGYVPENKFENVIKVGDYKTMAQKSCTPDGRGFNCFDLTFIYTLMTQGYGLSDDKDINIYKKINGHEASWALGLAYNILS